MDVPENIFTSCGLSVQHYERVRGGDINDAYCVITPSGKFFLKLNDRNKYPAMFEKEAKGLDLLRKHSSFMIPPVIKHGNADNNQFLILGWLEKGSPQNDIWEKFGQALAMMHKQTKEYFGLDEDNYIGSLKQHNDQYAHWSSFYANCRIMPLIKMLVEDRAVPLKEMDSAYKLCNKLKNIFPEEPSSLLHGDLWAGNYLIHSSGHAAIFDPAVYYGHREMDIGMAKLFGGFHPQFYYAYDQYYPMEAGWQERLPLTQLYPVLVHAVLFGGHYIPSALSIIKRFA